MFPEKHIPALENRYYCTGRELGTDSCECLYSPLDKYSNAAIDAVGYAGVTWHKISYRADCCVHEDASEFSYHVH